jgi:hypothetical protein
LFSVLGTALNFGFCYEEGAAYGHLAELNLILAHFFDQNFFIKKVRKVSFADLDPKSKFLAALRAANPFAFGENLPKL